MLLAHFSSYTQRQRHIRLVHLGRIERAIPRPSMSPPRGEIRAVVCSSPLLCISCITRPSWQVCAASAARSTRAPCLHRTTLPQAPTLPPHGYLGTVIVSPLPRISDIAHPFRQVCVASAAHSTRAPRPHRTSPTANADALSPSRYLTITNPDFRFGSYCPLYD